MMFQGNGPASFGERFYMKSINADLVLKCSQAFTRATLPLKVRDRLPALFKSVLKTTRRHLQLTAMKRVIGELRKRGVPLRHLHALEVFGSFGDGHVKDYASQVSSLEVWEVDPQCEKPLKTNFPMATIKITDSYQEIKRSREKYDFIVVDNGISIKAGGYCEHFDLFPDIFRVAKHSCVLILNVVPEIDYETSKTHPYVFNDRQLARRGVFYDTEHPEKVTFARMVKTYKDLCSRENFRIDWHFFQRRNCVYYLVLHISKIRMDQLDGLDASK
jgi:hypothetical protein